MHDRKRIIVVEDDPGILEAISIILLAVGYQVTAFPDGAPILEMNFEMPDIFILDKQLQGVDGLDLCRHLKRTGATQDIPVIMISANPSIRVLAKEAGADGAIEKPFSMKALRNEVAAQLQA